MTRSASGRSTRWAGAAIATFAFVPWLPLAQSSSGHTDPVELPEMIGVVYSARARDITSEIEGMIDSLHVALGDRAERGALLAQLTDWSVRYDLDIARAALEGERAELRQAELELEHAESEAARRQAVTDVWSEEDVASARHERDVAVAALAAARARTRGREATVARLARVLAATSIRAPFDGSIAVLHVEAGVVVHTGTPVVRLVDTSELWVRFAVPEAFAGCAVIGRPISVTVEATEARLTGVIRRVGAEVDAATQSLVVEAGLDPLAAEHMLPLPGMTARVRVTTQPVQRQ